MSMSESIRFDRLEHHRIDLEQNLPDLPIHLSDPDNSVEFPRHNSNQDSFSFHRADRTELHPMHAWSQTADDDDAINPYAGGETMSTAAHHASALTLSAGLGLGRARREPSLSGAEYDPERPLGEMIAAVDMFGMFDVEPSKSHYPPAVSFDPLIVDSTAELDRILRSADRSPHSSATSSSDVSTRPKLSDALHRIAFSPTRPRSAQSNCSIERIYHHRNDDSTPKSPSKRPALQPEVLVQPPTPSTAGSKFTKMARGLTREIEESRWDEKASSRRKADSGMGSRKDGAHSSHKGKQATSSRRNPFSDLGNRPGDGRGIQLPDVTGLTNAVDSPAKPGLPRHYGHVNEGVRESEARLLNTLTNVQAQLSHLENQNSISRRRVRELELELEGCKRDVRRERTRVHERDAVIEVLKREKEGKDKGKGREVEVDGDMKERYKEVVEEKKALEALILSLRAHLTRLTAELSSHKALLAELRAFRDTDARQLQGKSEEVDRLKEEVERLASEVEVLKGVVEEGLRQRRVTREINRVSVRDADDIEDEDQRRQIPTLRPAAPTPTHAPTLSRADVNDPETPFPQIRGGHLERLFFSAPEHNTKTCNVCHRPRPRRPRADSPPSWLPSRNSSGQHDDKEEGLVEAPLEKESHVPMTLNVKGKQRERVTFVDEVEVAPCSSSEKGGVDSGQDGVPPQTVLTGVLRELEDDFTHYKSIYVELADQYKLIDAISNIAKRNTLAQHLQEVIDILEQKGDQIASLYGLLTFKDKPASHTIPKQPLKKWGRSGLNHHVS